MKGQELLLLCVGADRTNGEDKSLVGFWKKQEPTITSSAGQLGFLPTAWDPVAGLLWGLSGAGEPCVQGWAQATIWQAWCIPVRLGFSARCFLSRAMPARQLSAPHFPLPFLPPLCCLSCGSSSRPACCRSWKAPSSFPSLLLAVSLGLNSALPRKCLQHKQISSSTHVPLCPEQS